MKKFISLICIMMFLISTYVFADETTYDPNLLMTLGVPENEFVERIENSNNFNAILGDVSAILAAVGVGVAMCVGVIYAVMWITSTPQKKADLKERIFPLFLGIFLLFAGPSLAATVISALAHMIQ